MNVPTLIAGSPEHLEFLAFAERAARIRASREAVAKPERARDAAPALTGWAASVARAYSDPAFLAAVNASASGGAIRA